MATKAKLISDVKADLGISKAAAEQVVMTVMNNIAGQLTDSGTAVLPGIGKLKVKVRKARVGHNPRTGEIIEIAEREVVKFSASKVFWEGRT